MQFKKVKAVILPVFKIEDEKEYFLKFDSEFFIGKEINNSGEVSKKPAMIANVTDMQTGEEGQIVANQVLHSSLTEAYEAGSYVGKVFSIIKHKPKAGKSYATFSLVEVEAV